MTAHQKLLAQELIPFLDRLTLRQRDVIERRYGLVDGTTHTLEAIAADIAVSPNRVRQIEATAFALLRRRWETAQNPTCGYCKDCKWWHDQYECWCPSPLWRTSDFDENLCTKADFGCVQFEPKE